jgi:hypothetical protein
MALILQAADETVVQQTPASESFDFGDFSQADRKTEIFNERQMQLLVKTFEGKNVTMGGITTACLFSGNFEALWEGLCEFLDGNELLASRTIRTQLNSRQEKNVQAEIVYDDV